MTYPRTDARVLSSAVAKEIQKNIGGLRNVPTLSGFASEVLENGAYKKIAGTRYVNDKQIVPTDVNGKTVDVLLYKGTTYLPVRAVANALDQAVAWDGASYSVYIGSHKDV